MQDSEEYRLTEEAIEQGKHYYGYKNESEVYRENTMAQNFMREFDKLENEDVMGIYGSAHTLLDAMNYTGEVPCMANQLSQVYKNQIESQDLVYLSKLQEPIRVDTITVKGKEYQASYYGDQDMIDDTGKIANVEFWRLENAYDDFKDCNVDENEGTTAFYSYPMVIELKQIYIMDLKYQDGTVTRTYNISNGFEDNGYPATQQFEP